MKEILNSYKDLNFVNLEYRAYVQGVKSIEFVKILPNHMSYNLYMKDNFCPDLMNFIDEQVNKLNILIAELEDKMQKL
jgi:hypothetical protein